MYKEYILLKVYDFDDIRFKLLEAEKNGITLCKTCHRQLHKGMK